MVCVEGTVKYFVVHGLSSDVNRALFYKTLIYGDSGNPGFFVINNQLVFSFHTMFIGSGTNVSMYVSKINEAMASLQGGEDPYQLSFYDLNCFSSVLGDIEVLPQQSFSVANDVLDGTLLGVVDVDTNSSAELEYYIVSGNEDGVFELDSETGELLVADSNAIDLDSTSVYDLNIGVGFKSLGYWDAPIDSNFGIVKVYVLPAGTANIVYFYPSVDTNWSKQGNWFSDYEHTSSLGRIPNSTDGAILLGSSTVTASAVGFVAPKYINSTANLISFTDSGDVNVFISGDANFGGTVRFLGTVIGNVTLNNTSKNAGTINGNVTALHSSCPFSATSDRNITGDLNIAYVSSTEYVLPSGCTWGTVLGSVKNNSGTIITDFNFLTNDRYNYGTVPGNAVFGHIGLEGFANGYHANYGNVDGNVTYYGVVGTTTITLSSGSWYPKIVGGVSRNRAGQIITAIIFQSGTQNNGVFYGNATFNETAKNYGKVYGSAVFNSDSGNNQADAISRDCYVYGNATFNDNSRNYGNIVGDTTFNGSSSNIGSIVGSVVFNGTSSAWNTVHNGFPYHSVIVGDVNINDSSRYDYPCLITGNVYVNDSTAGIMGNVEGNIVYLQVIDGILTTSKGFGTATGTIKGIDGIDINTGLFTGSAENYGILSSATFSGTSGNMSTGIIENATFDTNSKNTGTITGNALFDGNFSENNYFSTQGIVLGTKTRKFNQDINATTRNFITNGPWTIIANNATVTMIDPTKYDENTIFKTENGGSFVGPSIHGLLDENVNGSGFDTSDLNVTVSDQNLFNKRFIGLKPVRFGILDQNLMSFDYNFSANDLNLARIRIEKGTNHLIVDLNGQLQDGQTKTLYLEDNNYTHICVKDARIDSVNEISSNCGGADEYYFSSCINGTQTLGGITCTDLGDIITIEGLTHSAILGKIIIQTNSGSCTPAWNCTDWGACVDGNQSRVCTKANNCGTALLGKPIESKSCVLDENITQPKQDIKPTPGDSLADSNTNLIQPILDVNQPAVVTPTDLEAQRIDYSWLIIIVLGIISIVGLISIKLKQKNK